MQVQATVSTEVVAVPQVPVKASNKAIEWTGAVCGLLGSVLLAAHTAYSGYGFILFLVSNACWLWFGLRTKTWGMVAMQCGFTMTSLLGISNWLL